MRKKFLSLLALLFAVIILPTMVKASVIDDYKVDGKIVFKSIKPRNFDELLLFYENLFYPTFEENKEFFVDYCNDDLTRCEFVTGFGENDTHEEVDVVYEYDSDVKNVIDEIVANLPQDKDVYELTEMELISYLYNNTEFGSVANYSSELKKYINYKNYGIDIRLGDDAPFYTERGGNALFTYQETIYYNSDMVIRIASNHFFYIPSDSTDITKAVQERLSKNFKGWQFEITKLTWDEFLTNRRSELEEEYNAPENEWIRDTYQDVQEYVDESINQEYLADDAFYHHVVGAEDVIRLTINGKDEFEGVPLYFIVKKDSQKMVDNTFITVDSQSNITVKTTENIPLDALVQVAKVTSGEEYDKIIEILSVTNSEMFDLKLFSSSVGHNITKLDNGSFEVRIPISDSLKGKDLIVYFVDENDNIREYNVTIDGDYAVFNTDHFSIYTLAEVPEVGEPFYHITYNFNGGIRQGEREYVTEQAGYVVDISEEAFINALDVTAPEGKELEAILANDVRIELGGNYVIDHDTVFQYLWKDIPSDDPVLPDQTEEDNPQETTEPTNISNEVSETGTSNETTDNIANPQTGDNVLVYVLIFAISILGLIGMAIYLKKNSFNK